MLGEQFRIINLNLIHIKPHIYILSPNRSKPFYQLCSALTYEILHCKKLDSERELIQFLFCSFGVLMRFSKCICRNRLQDSRQSRACKCVGAFYNFMTYSFCMSVVLSLKLHGSRKRKNVTKRTKNKKQFHNTLDERLH